jgi:hypothetical protein
LDILFSDHVMSAKSLEQFGQVIQAIHRVTEDPAVRFWAFIVYVSKHPAQLLSAEPPLALAQDVQLALERAELPRVEVEPGRRKEEFCNGPSPTALDVSPALFTAYYSRHQPFRYTQVDLLLRDGRIVRSCLLSNDREGGKALVRSPARFVGEDIVAIRSPPGCFGWFSRPAWIREDTFGKPGT